MAFRDQALTGQYTIYAYIGEAIPKALGDGLYAWEEEG